MKQTLLAILLISVLMSCGKKRSDTGFYYPLDSLFAAQTKHLASAKATLTKNAIINGKSEAGSYVPKTDTVWLEELGAFAALSEINKPINVGKYKTEQGIKDVSSNLLIYAIESTEESPIDYIKIYYLNTLADIRKIEASYREASSLMQTTRELSMEFQNINNKIVLTSYSLAGGQKMLLGDSVTFSVHSTITLP